MYRLFFNCLALLGLSACALGGDGGTAVSRVLGSTSGGNGAMLPLVVDRDDDEDAYFPCTDEANDCTLRAAIQLANEHKVGAAIRFAQHYRIDLTQPLPALLAENTSIVAEAGQVVQVNGANLAADVLVIRGSYARIEGLHVYGAGSGFANVAITDHAHDVVIARNVIGDDDAPSGNCENGRVAANGIVVDAQSSDAAVTRAWIYENVIECHNQNGILLRTGNVVIGRDQNATPNGNFIQHNWVYGVDLGAQTGNVVCHNVMEQNGVEGFGNVVFNDNSIMENVVR